MSKVLVFGASGFLGREVVDALLQNHHEVLAITRSLQADQPDRFRPDVTWIQGDLYQAQDWIEQLQGVTSIVHLVGNFVEDPSKGQTYQHVILESAQSVGQMAKDQGIGKIVFVSADIDNPSMPPAYVQAKKQAEEYLKSLGIDLYIFRPGMMYGKNKPESIERAQKILANLDETKPGWRHRPIQVTHVGLAIAKVLGQETSKKLYTIQDIEDLVHSQA